MSLMVPYYQPLPYVNFVLGVYLVDFRLFIQIPFKIWRFCMIYGYILLFLIHTTIWNFLHTFISKL